MLGTRGGSGLKPQAGLGFFRQQLPSFEFDAQENLVTGRLAQKDVGEGLCLPHEAVKGVFLVRIPRVPDQIQGANDLLFNRRAEHSIERVQIGRHDTGNVGFRAKVNRQARDGLAHIFVQLIMLPVRGRQFSGRRGRFALFRHNVASLSTAAA